MSIKTTNIYLFVNKLESENAKNSVKTIRFIVSIRFAESRSNTQDNYRFPSQS